MMMNISLFQEFLSSLSRISQWEFELWDLNGLLFTSAAELDEESSTRMVHRDFSAEVIREETFRHTVFEGKYDLFGAPTIIGGDVVGSLIAYRPNTHGAWQSEDIPSGKRPHGIGMESFLTHMTTLMEETWTTQKEAEEMAEELMQSFEALSLYGRISTQIKALPLSDTVLKNLITEILEAVSADLAFVMFPDYLEYNTFMCNEGCSGKISDPNAFVKAIVNSIPQSAPSLADNFFIVNDSTRDPGYRELHPDPYRFLVVIIEHSGIFYGWLGLVSFDLKQIFQRGELKLLKSVASSAAIAMQNSQLYAETLQTAKKERFIRNIFQKYVPEEVANEILERGDRDLIKLGENRLVTLLNVDIRGYTRMSKSIKPEDIVKVLNYFFMIMGTIILKHKGILDKYLGDGVLAIFGAPVTTPNHALDATLAAIEMVENLETFNEFVQKLYGIPLKIGISINTGRTIVGNIGFTKKMDYTVIGDVVNDTFRLQELTREKPNSIFISKSTHSMVHSFIHTRSLGMKSLGDKENQVEIYEVTGKSKDRVEKEPWQITVSK